MSKVIIELSETSEIIIGEIIALLIILIIARMIYKINNIWSDKSR